MSRHDLTPNADYPDCWVAVGWDRPLNTFFGQVFRTPPDDAGDDEEILWVGMTLGEVPDVGRLRELMSPYSDIPDEIARQLVIDRTVNPYR